MMPINKRFSLVVGVYFLLAVVILRNHC